MHADAEVRQMSRPAGKALRTIAAPPKAASRHGTAGQVNGSLDAVSLDGSAEDAPILSSSTRKEERSHKVSACLLQDLGCEFFLFTLDKMATPITIRCQLRLCQIVSSAYTLTATYSDQSMGMALVGSTLTVWVLC